MTIHEKPDFVYTGQKDFFNLEKIVYPSAAQASRDLEIGKPSISRCLRGLKPQADGYKFVYYEREEENGIKNC